MAQRTVNARQLEVLRWIVNGCPEGVMTGDTHKTTAVALKGRRLVEISKKGGVWRATPTAAGRHFVEHGAYPDGHWLPAREPKPESVRVPRLSPQTPGRETERRVTGLRPVDQFMADLLSAGGSLSLEHDKNNYAENLAKAAIRHNKVPDDKLLQIRGGRRYGEKTIELVDKPGWMTAVLEPIRVPERLTRPHPAVVALRADREHRLRFKRDVRQRALLLLNALAREAVARGYTVECPARQRYERKQVSDLIVEVNGHRFELDVSEDTNKVPHEATVKELRDFETRGWPRIPKYDHVPSGRLSIAIGGGLPVGQSAFGDTRRLNLNDRLAHILQEVELRAAAAEERRLQKEREDDERRRQWEHVHAEALNQHVEQGRAAVLRQQSARWHEYRALTDYADALTATLASTDDDAKPATEEWLAWIRQHLDDTRPFREPVTMPTIPAPSADDLKPFMKGLSPHGPDRYPGGW